MRLEDAVKLSDNVRALTNQLLDAITDLIEDEPTEPTPARPVGAATRLSTLGRWRTRVANGDPAAVALRDVVASHGWVVDGTGGRGRIVAIEALERAHRYDPVALDAALWVITSAWGYDRMGVDGRILEGLTLVMSRDLELTRSAIAEHLRRQWTPDALLDTVKRKRDEAHEAVGTPPRSCEIAARIVTESLGGA